LPAGGDALAPELASTHRGSTAPAPVAVFSHSAHMPLVLHFFAHNSKVAGMSLVADLPAQGLVSCIETVPQSALCGPDGLVSFQWDNFAAGRCNFVGTQHGPHVFEQLFYPAARARGLHEARVRHYFILREPIGQIKSMYAHAQVAGSEGYDFVRHIGFAEYVHLTAIRSRNLSLYAKWDSYNFQTLFLAPSFPVVPLGAPCPSAINGVELPTRPNRSDLVYDEGHGTYFGVPAWFTACGSTSESLDCAARILALPSSQLPAVTNASNLNNVFTYGILALPAFNQPTLGPEQQAASMAAHLSGARDAVRVASAVGTLVGNGYSGFMCLFLESVRGTLPMWCDCTGGFNATGAVPTWTKEDHGNNEIDESELTTAALQEAAAMSTFDSQLYASAGDEFIRRLEARGLACMGPADSGGIHVRQHARMSAPRQSQQQKLARSHTSPDLRGLD